MWMKIPNAVFAAEIIILGKMCGHFGMFPRNLTMNIVYDLPRSLRGLIPPSHPFRTYSEHPLPRNREKNNEQLWITMNNYEQPLKNHEETWKTMNNHENNWKKRWKPWKNMKNNEKTTMNIQAAVIERQLPEDCDVLQQLNVLLLESSQAWMNVNHGFLIRDGPPPSRSFFSDFIWYFHGTPIYLCQGGALYKVRPRHFRFLSETKHINNSSLVGGWPTPLKKMSSSVGMMTFPTEWTNKKTCSKPPTSYIHQLNHLGPPHLVDS